MKKPGFTTRSLNVPFVKTDPHNSLQMPLYETVAFEFDSSEQIEVNFKGEYVAHVYSRSSSPTVEYFEMKMKALTESHAVLAVSSGMASVSNATLTVQFSDSSTTSNSALPTQILPDSLIPSTITLYFPV